MTDLMESDVGIATHVGCRLHRLEVFNWGTFDSANDATRGHVYRVEPEGRTTLLIGQNGSGKSTLVDALLTLLVRPAVRNYNVAAGAKKRERDERTYIKGAFDRRSRDEDNRADVQFLRPDGNHYSVLLACFKNERTGTSFTLAVVLYLNTEGRARKVYCFAPDERSIAADCAGFKSMEKLTRQLKDRGFRATDSYTEYYEWFRNATGVQPKAMDMFNQTVAVKDIERLNDFIRDHMLEHSLREDDINSLLTHYDQLNDAHQNLVRVREQKRLLEPIAETGAEWQRQSAKLADVRSLIDASHPFFCQKTLEVFEPECEARRLERDQLEDRKERLSQSIDEAREECWRLMSQIDQAGGDRMRLIPVEIEKHTTAASAKRRENVRLHQALRAAGLSETVASQKEIDSIQQRLVSLKQDSDAQIESIKEELNQLVFERADAIRVRNGVQEELTSLEQRRENLPPGLAELRRNLCDELGLPVDELRFAGELMRVHPDDQAWESSIEMLLRGFALSLLVPDRHYQLVSSYVDRTRLANRHGDGLRLDYLRVGDRKKSRKSVADKDSIIRKLQFRDGHPLLPWLKSELQERFDYRCCETIEEFQLARDLAVTKDRHVKRGTVRHTKDDRTVATNPRNYVLGWDNREKRQRLADEIARWDSRIAELNGPLKELESRRAQCDAQLAAIEALAEFHDYSAVDFQRHEQAVTELELERQKLEEGSDQIRALKKRMDARKSEEAALVLQLQEVNERNGVLKKELLDAETLVSNAHSRLEDFEADGTLENSRKQFDRLDKLFMLDPLSAENFFDRRDEIREAHRAELDRLREELKPLERLVQSHMTGFLKKYPEENSDLTSSVDYLESYLGLLAAINEEDLPRHEQRFKEHLNDKVTREVGSLHGTLQLERTSIEDKIELLNGALRQLEYRPGTHMRLEAKLVRDREIVDFLNALRSCLDDSFDGSFEADESRFERIKSLISHLREEDRWRKKVTDVRRWFDFAARELDNHSGEERSYYEDSTGQSGGEKAKLAFTILVAAIAYQYDIDPDRDSSDRFHFVVIDEMFSKVDDQYSEYALRLFERFGLQLLIVAPLDAKARITDGHVECYLLVTKDEQSHSAIHTMTARDFEDQTEEALPTKGKVSSRKRRPRKPK